MQPIIGRHSVVLLVLALTACANVDSGKFTAMNQAAQSIGSSSKANFATIEDDARAYTILGLQRCLLTD